MSEPMDTREEVELPPLEWREMLAYEPVRCIEETCALEHAGEYEIRAEREAQLKASLATNREQKAEYAELEKEYKDLRGGYEHWVAQCEKAEAEVREQKAEIERLSMVLRGYEAVTAGTDGYVAPPTLPTEEKQMKDHMEILEACKANTVWNTEMMTDVCYVPVETIDSAVAEVERLRNGVKKIVDTFWSLDPTAKELRALLRPAPQSPTPEAQP